MADADLPGMPGMLICPSCGCVTPYSRQPYLPPEDVETLRDIAENTSDAAAFECLTAIIAKLEGKP